MKELLLSFAFEMALLMGFVSVGCIVNILFYKTSSDLFYILSVTGPLTLIFGYLTYRDLRHDLDKQ